MMSSKPEATNKARIFISYRFADKPVAEVIRKSLTWWGFDNIYFARGGRSTQSPRVGENLSDQLRNALAEAELVILVYTLADEDWSWCMWECGLASALGEIDSTRVVVFQCNISDTPKVFSDDVLVRVEDPTSIRDFTKQLHKDAGFFKDRPAYRPDYSDQDLEDLSSTFYQELARVLPSVLPAGELEERYRWDRFTLKLEHPADFLDTERNEDMSKRIQSELVVTNPFGNALRHFGLADPRDDLKLSDLVERWTRVTRSRENVTNDWIEGLCFEIQRAINNYPAEPHWQALNSVEYGKPYYPVINHMRILPDSSMEFDVYLYADESNQ